MYTVIAFLDLGVFLASNAHGNKYSYLSHLLPFRQIYSSIAKHILTVAFSIPVLFSIMLIPHIRKKKGHYNSSLCK